MRQAIIGEADMIYRRKTTHLSDCQIAIDNEVEKVYCGPTIIIGGMVIPLEPENPNHWCHIVTRSHQTLTFSVKKLPWPIHKNIKRKILIITGDNRMTFQGYVVGGELFPTHTRLKMDMVTT